MATDTLQSNQLPNNTIQPFKSHLLSKLFTFDNKPIIILGTIDNPLFVGKQICDILGYVNPTRTMNLHIENKWRTKYKNLTDKHPEFSNSTNLLQFNFRSDTDLITEAGLYSLIFNSKLEKAKIFRDTVFEQVLPSIRKTGQFKIEQLELQLQEASKTIKHIESSRQQLLLRQRRTVYEIGNAIYVISNKAFSVFYKDDYFKFGKVTQKKDEDDAAFMRRLSAYNTGSPENYDVNALFYIKENTLIENSIKVRFAKKMNPINKEWIKGEKLETIVDFIRAQCQMLQLDYKEVDCSSLSNSSKVSKVFEDEETLEDAGESANRSSAEVSDGGEFTESLNLHCPVEDETKNDISESEDESDSASENGCSDNESEEEDSEYEESEEESDDKTKSEPLYDMEKIKMYSNMSKEELSLKFTSKQLGTVLAEFNMTARGLKDAQLTRLKMFCEAQLKNPTMQEVVKEDDSFELFYTLTSAQGFKFYQRKSDMYIGLSTLSMSCKKPLANWTRNKTLQKEREEYLKKNPSIKPFAPSLGGTSNEKSWADKYFALNYIKWANITGLEEEFTKFLNRENVWDLPTTKRCSCCKKRKEYSEYSQNKRMVDGYDRRCRSCYKKRYEDEGLKARALTSYHKHKNKAVKDISCSKMPQKPWK
jgi:prophage antirepressor-like protein